MVSILPTYPESAKTAHAVSALDRVRLVDDLPCQNGLFPAGSIGTVVHRYRDARAFEVEFMRPEHAVLTVQSDQIEPAGG
ncbi:MAG: DUF4926 domain-containing protein [Caulobacteraceae bacterium]